MIKEYVQSITRHAMTVIAGLNIVSEGETIESAFGTFIDKIGTGDPQALLTAGLVLASLVWSALEKVHHDKEVEVLKKKCEEKQL